jgi:ankyrin repeat protein
LVENGADVNANNNKKETVLMSAIQCNKVKLVEYLVE